jgi:hypothetical protein
MKKLFLLVVILLFIGVGAKASTLRTIDGDSIASSDKTVSRVLPSANGTLMVSSGVIKEIPTGTVNGSNTSFVLANTPNVSATVQVFINGVLQEVTTDYTISSATISMVSAPVAGQKIYVVYSKY